MKKLIALAAALVLALGLSTTAFAAVYNGGQLLNDTLSDEEAIYHVHSFDSYDTLKIWAYFDGDQQSQTFTFQDENGAPAYLKYNDEPVKYNGRRRRRRRPSPPWWRSWPRTSGCPWRRSGRRGCGPPSSSDGRTWPVAGRGSGRRLCRPGGP